jgi:hypothetical protein
VCFHAQSALADVYQHLCSGLRYVLVTGPPHATVAGPKPLSPLSGAAPSGHATPPPSAATTPPLKPTPSPYNVNLRRRSTPNITPQTPANTPQSTVRAINISNSNEFSVAAAKGPVRLSPLKGKSSRASATTASPGAGAGSGAAPSSEMVKPALARSASASQFTASAGTERKALSNVNLGVSGTNTVIHAVITQMDVLRFIQSKVMVFDTGDSNLCLTPLFVLCCQYLELQPLLDKKVRPLLFIVDLMRLT